MTSLTAGIALLILGSLLGLSLSQKITDKKKLYKALLTFNHDFLMEVEFQRNDLLTMLKRKYPSEDFNNILMQKISIINGVKNDLIFPNYLTDSEKAELQDYFNKLGLHDCNTASIFFERYAKIYSNIYSEIVQEERVKGALYKKMGVILGIIACVIVM
jgi:hypothetical protein